MNSTPRTLSFDLAMEQLVERFTLELIDIYNDIEDSKRLARTLVNLIPFNEIVEGRCGCSPPLVDPRLRWCRMKGTPVLIGDLCADHVGRQVVADKYRGVIVRVTHWRDDGCPVTEIEIEQNYDKGIQPVRFHSPSYAVVVTEDMSVRTEWTLRDVGELADEFERQYKVRMSSDTFACGVMHAVRDFRALAAASEEETS